MPSGGTRGDALLRRAIIDGSDAFLPCLMTVFLLTLVKANASYTFPKMTHILSNCYQTHRSGDTHRV